MQITTDEIVTLARRAGVRFGAHAFMVIACFPDGFRDAWTYTEVRNGDVAHAKASAQSIADDHAKRHTEKTFELVEVGAPVVAFSPALARACGMIETMKGLLNDALTNHIYDESNGDVIPDDCPYTGAIADADAFLETDLRNGGDPLQIGVCIEGGIVQMVWPEVAMSGVELVVIDYDVDGTDDDVQEVQQQNLRWAAARIATFDLSIEASPIPAIRPMGASE